MNNLSCVHLTTKGKIRPWVPRGISRERDHVQSQCLTQYFSFLIRPLVDRPADQIRLLDESKQEKPVIPMAEEVTNHAH